MSSMRLPCLLVLLVIAGGLVGFASAPRAQTIDCSGEEMSFEFLLCEDPLLAKLGEALGDVDADPALQSWVVAASKFCGFEEDGTMKASMRWSAVPCLIDAYQKKIREVHGKIDPELAAPVLKELDTVHPLCVKLAIEKSGAETGSNEPIPLRDCNRRYSHLKIEIQSGVRISEMPGDGVKASFFGYQIVGDMGGNAAALRTLESTGGSGLFSGISFVGPWPKEGPVPRGPRAAIRALGGLAFGDRCNGGLESVKIPAPGRVEATVSITPADLFTFEIAGALRREKNGRFEVVEQSTTEPRSPRIAALKHYDDLDASAASCIGKATITLDTNAATSRLVSVTVTELLDATDWNPGAKYQACFNKTVGEALNPLPKTLKPAELAALAGKFEQACLQDQPAP